MRHFTPIKKIIGLFSSANAEHSADSQEKLEQHSGKSTPLRYRLTETLDKNSFFSKRRLSNTLPLLISVLSALLLLIIWTSVSITLRHVLIVNLDTTLANSLQQAQQLSRQTITEKGLGDGILPKYDPNSAESTTVQPRLDPAPKPDPELDGKPDHGGKPRHLNTPGALLGAITLVKYNDDVFAGKVGKDFTTESLTSTQVDSLLELENTRHRTVTWDWGETYRVLTWSGTNDKGAAVKIVVALPMRDTDGILYGFMGYSLLYIVIGLLVVGLASRFLTKKALTNLEKVTASARAVTKADLNQEVDLSPLFKVDLATSKSEAGELAQAFNTMLKHIEQSLHYRAENEQRLRQFLADASHELRTPVATISGYAQLLNRVDLSDDEREQAISRINSESKRMGRLVADLLLLSRLERGLELEKTPLALAGLVVDSLADGHVNSPDHDWDLDLSPEGMECEIHGDETRLRQVIANLTNNAYQHTPAGTKITLSLQVVPAADSPLTELNPATKLALLEVSDNGPGIAKEIADKIFDRFVRADSARTPGESTGLGLAIALAVVKAHEGEITFRDTEGGGATFQVWLPIIEDSLLSGNSKEVDSQNPEE